jgi:hypothetical protein
VSRQTARAYPFQGAPDHPRGERRKKILKKIFFSFHEVRRGLGSEREKIGFGPLDLKKRK